MIGTVERADARTGSDDLLDRRRIRESELGRPPVAAARPSLPSPLAPSSDRFNHFLITQKSFRTELTIERGRDVDDRRTNAEDNKPVIRVSIPQRKRKTRGKSRQMFPSWFLQEYCQVTFQFLACLMVTTNM